MRRLITIGLVLALVVPCGVAVSPALADDDSVRVAWQKDDKRYAAVDRDLRRSISRWAGRGFKNQGPVKKVVKRGQRLVERTRDRVEAEEPSTESGTSAKRFVLRALGKRAQQYASVSKGLKMLANGNPAGFNRIDKATGFQRQAKRNAKKARELFVAARDEPPLEPTPSPTA